MNVNFELILFYACLVTGVVSLIDVVWLAPARRGHKLPLVIDYSRAFFPVLVLVFLLRSFFFEPYRIPSGSLEPTLLPGDFILVNKFAYGIRLPVIHKKIFGQGEPARGDIMVFRWPPNPSVDFIKRVIGVPGDHINYVDKELYINGQKIPQEYLKNEMALDEEGDTWQATEKSENLLGVRHDIYINDARPSHDYKDIIVPPGMYFVMGDNRDDSADSRYFGFVPDANIVGKAMLVWMSWDGINYRLRFNRMGRMVRSL